MKAIQALLIILVTLFGHSSNAIGQAVPDTDDDRRSELLPDSLMPKPRSWDELKHLMALDALDYQALNLDECIAGDRSLKKVGRYYQNILYSDYIWEDYRTRQGKRCIKLVSPDIGMLSWFDASILLSASRGHAFDKLGFWGEAEYYGELISDSIAPCLASEMKVSGPGVEPVSPDIQSQCIEEDESYQQGSEATRVVIGDDSRVSISIEVARSVYPYMAFLEEAQRDTRLSQECLKSGSGFFINANTVLTVAHNIFYKRCRTIRWFVYSYLPDANTLVNFQGRSGLINNDWGMLEGDNDGIISNHRFDFGAIKTILPNPSPVFYPLAMTNVISIAETEHDRGLTLGYPKEVAGQIFRGTLFREELSKPGCIFNHGCIPILPNISSRDLLIANNFDLTEGHSGGPLFFTQSPPDVSQSPPQYDDDYRVIGIMSATVGATSTNYATPIDNYSHPIITQWAQQPPPNIAIDITSPAHGQQLSWYDIDDSTFALAAQNSSNRSMQSEINKSFRWSSDLDGEFGAGAAVNGVAARSILRPGEHLISATIDTAEYLGAAHAVVSITGPDGAFDSNSLFCIVDLRHSANTCEVHLNWQTFDAPDAIIWNQTDNLLIANSPSGHQFPFPVSSDERELVLFATPERLFAMDSITVSAKIPTGTLSASSAECSLEPSPIAPDGTSRDPQATPPGCGVELSWSDVQWASPSIFYRTNGGAWQHLYEISCGLNGDICNDSIHTDELIAELIPETGVEFAMLQFDSSDSGQLGNTVAVSGRRIADVYEYDNGMYSAPGNALTGVNLSTAAMIGVPQHNHSFHRTFVTGTIPEVDTTYIVSNQFVGQTLSVNVFNQAPGLEVDMRVLCDGFRAQDTGSLEPIYGLWEFPAQNNPVIGEVASQNGFTTMNFAVQKEVDIAGPYNLNCLHNLIEIRRVAGEAGENLTYSVVVNLGNGNSVPVITALESVCANNYCIRILGEGFATDALVSVRENSPNSPVLTTFSGNDIYVRTPLNGQERLQFPTRNPAIQEKFRNAGLCFKVISNGTESNEECLSRPATAAQPPLLGSVVRSYQGLSEDPEFDAYVVQPNGQQIKFWGNSWKEIDFAYQITPETILEFEFRSNRQEPEINGIGFIAAGETTLRQERFWQVHGTQPWGVQNFHDYSGTDFRSYRIPVGQIFTGSVTKMVFAADEDVHVGQNVVFRNIRLSEGVAVDQYDDVPALRDYDDDIQAQGVSWAATDTQHLHNFHDAGDTDWTLVFMDGTRRIRTELIGGQADSRLAVYRWLDVDVDPNAAIPYSNIVDELVAVDTSAGASEIVITAEQPTIFGIKAESRNGVSGAGTEYLLIIDTPDGATPDQYDDVPALRAYADDQQEQGVSWGDTDVQHFHNFHDAGDVDWTLIYLDGGRRIRTELIGANADTKMSVYRWLDVDVDPNATIPYSNIVDQLVASDHSAGPSEVYVNTDEPAIFGIRVESRTNAFGLGTDYRLLIETPQAVAPDQYDDIPAQRAYNDDVQAQGVSWMAADTQHLHNFHAAGDVDWTLVYTDSGATRIRTELVGEYADTRLTVYRWLSADTSCGNDVAPYCNIVDEFVIDDSASGASDVLIQTSEPTIYGIKVESVNGAWGQGTDYRLIIDTPSS